MMAFQNNLPAFEGFDFMDLDESSEDGAGPSGSTAMPAAQVSLQSLMVKTIGRANFPGPSQREQ
jgi:hypothetical protein